MFFSGGKARCGGFAVTDFLVLVAILGVLLAVVAPNVMGYVNYEVEDIDSSNTVKIENAVLRSVSEGKIKLGDALKKSELEVEIKNRMGGKIPLCQRLGDNFYVDRYTGKVTSKSVAGDNDIALTSQTLAEGLVK